MNEIQLGSAVQSSDGHSIGTVDQIVINSDTRKLSAMILKEDWDHASDRILALGQVASVDEAGQVHVGMTLEEAKELPVYIKVTSNQMETEVMANSLFIFPQYYNNYEVTSDINENLMVIERGRNIVDGEMEKIGELDEVSYGEGGAITGIVVRTGFIRHHEYPISVDEIGGFGNDYIRVKMTKAEFEQRKG